MRITEVLTESSKICPQCGMRGCTCKPGYPKNIDEAANPAQQAAIAISMKEKGQKPKNEDVDEGFVGDMFNKAKGMFTKQRPATQQSTEPQIAKINMSKEQALDGYKKAIEASKNVRTTKANDFEARNKYEDALHRAEFFSLYLKQHFNIDTKQGVAEGENWSKHNNKRVGGMSKKSVSSYRRSHPGSKIQTAVTKKPSKIKKGSKDAKRRASFCARMRGMKKHRTSAKTARDPNSNINKSLRRWHCESIEQMQELVMIAEQKIRNLKK